MIWNEQVETLSRVDLENLQSERLIQLIKRVYENVEFYKQKLDGMKIKPSEIHDIQDLSRLPFTKKTDLRNNYPYGLFAVPMEKVSRIHASSGTTGKSTVVGYTSQDLKIWAELCARCFALSGAKPGQIFQNAYGYGLFTGGLGMHYGAEEMGLTVIPISGGNTSRQITVLQDFGTHVLACTPSYALTLADSLAERQIDPESLNLETLILGAEPWTELMRLEIEEKLKVSAINIYGLSEIIGPGVSNECIEEKNGSHIAEDHFIPEVINPETGKNLPAGEVGELVFTTLTKEAFPLIRYRTGDLASINYEPCRCGRTHARMSRVLGRTDDMLIIRGVNVFPSQIEEAMQGIDSITPHHQVIVTKKDRLDYLEVQVEVRKEFFRPDLNLEEEKQLKGEVSHKIHDILGLNVKVTLMPPQSVPRSEGGKLSRLVDMRKSS